MPSEAIQQLETLLAIHRQTLHHYLEQEARFGRAHTPPHITNSIKETRRDIQRIKETLRTKGLEVADKPGDEEKNDQGIIILTDPDYFDKNAIQKRPFDQALCYGATPADLDSEQRKYFFGLERVMQYFSAYGDGYEKLMLKMERDSVPTYGAILCFSPFPQQWIVGARTTCVAWAGTEQDIILARTDIITENLLEQYNASVKFFRQNLNIQRVREREIGADQWEIPFVVLREAIANALIHREYPDRNDGIYINIFKDRIEITNPGILPEDTKPEDFIVNPSKGWYRNPFIAEVFYFFDYIEQVGSGMLKMKREMENVGLPTPTFQQHQKLKKFTVILQRPNGMVIGFNPKGISGRETVYPATTRTKTLPLNTIPAPAPLPAMSRVPYSHNRLFVGREQALKTLAHIFKHNESTLPIAAVTGMGGIGKTQLASEFVHRYGQYFEGGVFWLSFADPNNIPNEIAACGINMNIPDIEPLSHQVARVQQEWQSPIPRLLVFDRCEDETLLHTWLPKSGGCAILVTSRSAMWEHANVQQIPLDTLARDESITLLRAFRPDLSPDDPDLDVLAHELGDLPLALHLAGSYLKQYAKDVTPARLLAQLQKQHLLAHRALSSRKHIHHSPTNHELSIKRTIAGSYEQLQPNNDLDALALNLLAQVTIIASSSKPVSHQQLLAAMQVDIEDENIILDMNDALARLKQLGLIEETSDGELRVHRLIAAFVQQVTKESTT